MIQWERANRKTCLKGRAALGEEDSYSHKNERKEPLTPTGGVTVAFELRLENVFMKKEGRSIRKGRRVGGMWREDRYRGGKDSAPLEKCR